MHRLVHISPFDSNARRQTSFASIVDVYPVTDDLVVVDIKESNLRIDTMRSGSAGDQHVNKTKIGGALTQSPTASPWWPRATARSTRTAPRRGRCCRA